MISATLLSKNSERHLRQVLEALAPFDEVLLYDNGSTDKTLSLASAYPNVTLKQGPFLGFGPTHNEASRLARNNWIFSVDTDEIPSPELLQEILSLKLTRGHVYTASRHNVYRGRHIKGCGWHPDRVPRLYHRLDTRFTDAQVHERIITKNLDVVDLKSPLYHYSYDNISDFLTKMNRYSELFAQDNQGKPSSPCKAILHGAAAFLKSYFLKRGFLDGYPGFIISVYNGHTAFYKYLKLYERNLNQISTP